MLVDDADMEMEMSKDPFLEAGITIPVELPYKDESLAAIRQFELK